MEGYELLQQIEKIRPERHMLLKKQVNGTITELEQQRLKDLPLEQESLSREWNKQHEKLIRGGK